MAMSPFRRSAAANTQKRQSKGGGFRGSWYDRLKFPIGTAIPFIFIPNAEYVDPNPPDELLENDPVTGRPKEVKNPYFKVKKHTRSIKKGTKSFFPDEVCSAGYDAHNPQPCVGCTAMDSGDKSVGLGEKFVFGIIDLRPYHSHPLIDYKSGQVRMKQDNSGPVITYTECKGRTCNYCRVLNGQQPVVQPGETWPGFQAGDISTVFGKRRYIEVGKGHLSNLMGWDQIVTSQCMGVIRDQNGNAVKRCGAQLISEGFECPTCNTMCIDLSNDPRTDEQIQEAVMKPYPCLTCNRAVLLQEVVSCDVCGNAVQSSIFGPVVLWGMRQGEGTDSQLVLQKFESLDDFAYSVPKHLLAEQTVQQIIEDLAKPYDFGELYKPRSLEDQAKRLELNVPARQTSAYSAPPQGQYIAGIAPPQPTFMPAAPQTSQAAPQQPKSPGPAPFVPPTRPNFSS